MEEKEEANSNEMLIRLLKSDNCQCTEWQNNRKR